MVNGKAVRKERAEKALERTTRWAKRRAEIISKIQAEKKGEPSKEVKTRRYPKRSLSIKGGRLKSVLKSIPENEFNNVEWLDRKYLIYCQNNKLKPVTTVTFKQYLTKLHNHGCLESRKVRPRCGECGKPKNLITEYKRAGNLEELGVEGDLHGKEF